ncbi:arylsulfatase B [Aplysia californica]|uniref:Arylsulfatase B n=1 Tax=Aplysia californica TaxID=6500 RepID=A0ABM0JGF7_APLCA|nr:arylsulfatase B [Aplysia californica]
MKIVCVFFVSFVCLLEKFADGKKSPNIVFIVSDDYGFRDIGYHGAEFATPNLDKLAADGVKLENYYVQPICSPTRSQLMTGRYQIHTGLQHSIIWPSQPYGVPLDDPTMADFLRGQGYSTHAVGKWHLGLYKKEHTPLHRGFDSFYGYWTGGEDYYKYYVCDRFHNRTIRDLSASGFLLPGQINNQQDVEWCGYDLRDGNEPVTTMNGTYSTHLYTRKSIELIEKASSSKQPLFLYLAYQAVHSPMEAPDKYIKPYSFIKNKYRRIYAGMVSAMDEGIGNITAALKQNGLWEDTILIFTTDNGGQILAGGNNWPLRGYKRTLWEGGMRGVGFVSGPALGRSGQISKELMHVSDWLPTVADMVGSKLNSSWKPDGENQWPMISKGKRSARSQILHNIDIWTPLKGNRLYNNTFDNRVRAAVRVGDYKLITGDPGDDRWIPPPHEEIDLMTSKEKVTDPADTKNLWLFNVRKDPSEVIDLSLTMPEKVVELLAVLATYNATAVPPNYPPSDPNCDPKLHGGYWGPWE